MKNVFQGIRDLPEYPIIVVVLIAILFVLFGIANLNLGYTLNFPNKYDGGQMYSQEDLTTLRDQLIPNSERYSFIQRMKPRAFELIMEHYSTRLFYPETPTTLTDKVYADRNGKNPAGIIIIIWGAIYLLTALLLLLRFRRTVLLILAVWIVYSCLVMINFISPTYGLPLFSNTFGFFRTSPGANELIAIMNPPLQSILIMVVIPLLIGAFLFLDERVKAYFGQGKFAEAYRAFYKDQKARRKAGEKKSLGNPWVVEQKS